MDTWPYRPETASTVTDHNQFSVFILDKPKLEVRIQNWARSDFLGSILIALAACSGLTASRPCNSIISLFHQFSVVLIYVYGTEYRGVIAAN